MSHDYVCDTFGEFVPTSPKYQEVENRAIRLLLAVCNGSITHDEIYEGFESVRKTMVELDDNVISPGCPFWLPQFLAYHFFKWRDWYRLQKAYKENPELFGTDEAQKMYNEIKEMGHDETFLEICRTCVKELEHKIKNLE